MRINIFIVLILLPFVANSKEYLYEYFVQADEYYDLKNYDKAIDEFKFIIEKFPEDELTKKALKKIIVIYQEQNQFEKVIELYKQMLDQHTNEKLISIILKNITDHYQKKNNVNKLIELYQQILNQNVGDKLIITVLYPIAEFYEDQNEFEKAIPFYKSIIGLKNIETNSFPMNIPDNDYDYRKHIAASRLSTIYENKEMYDSAIYFLDISENVYQYWSFCGNDIQARNYQAMLRYKNLYLKINQPDQAIHKLLSWFLLINNEEYNDVGELSDLLKDKKGLRAEFDTSLNNMYTKEIKINSNSYMKIYIKFLDNEYQVGFTEYTNDIKSKYKFYEDNLKHSNFYMLLKGME